MQLTAYIQRDPESGDFVAVIPGIPGAHTQASTMDELMEKTKEVVSLCLEDMAADERASLPEFIGVQQIQIAL